MCVFACVCAIVERLLSFSHFPIRIFRDYENAAAMSYPALKPLWFHVIRCLFFFALSSARLTQLFLNTQTHPVENDYLNGTVEH